VRTSLTNFFNLFRTGGIGDAKRQPRFSDDIQLTSIVQDLIPRGGGVGGGFVPGWQEPVPVLVQFGFHRFQSQVAAERTRLEILALATGGGIWITSIYSSQTQVVSAQMFTIPALTGLANRTLPTAANASAYGTGAAATAIVDMGTSAISSPASAERHNIGKGTQDEPAYFTGNGTSPTYIGPGRVFVIQLFTVNVPEFLGLNWIEIP